MGQIVYSTELAKLDGELGLHRAFQTETLWKVSLRIFGELHSSTSHRYS